METTVAETADKVQIKTADKLEPGDWVSSWDSTTSYPLTNVAEILFAHPSGNQVLIAYQRADHATPRHAYLNVRDGAVIATAGEIAEAKETARRNRVADRLRELANMFEEHQLPVERQVGLHISLPDVATLARLAEELAIGIQVTGRRHEVTWPAGDYWTEPFHATWSVYADPEPTADPTGLDYTRADTDADDPTPVSPGRVPLHTGAVTEAGLAAETAPAAEHYHVGGSVGGFGENSAECACGTTFDGFDTPAEATKLLDLHIEAATSPTGLTKAADQSRGVLAGTTPVVTYFSFGHGQDDPDTGKRLLDHYVTVVAPTYEACWEAMFASRFGRAWSFDYLAGTKRATGWIPRWTEHEVIVAPGITQAEAEDALIAAWNVLDVAASAE